MENFDVIHIPMPDEPRTNIKKVRHTLIRFPRADYARETSEN